METIQLTSSNGHPMSLTDGALQAFRGRLRGALLTPGDEGYDETRQIWNGMIDRRPALIARCTGTADVIEAVNFARESDLLVAVRGGGHNVAGSAVCDGGLMIDLSAMRGVHVDPAAHVAYVQGGATWGDVDRETQVYGLAAPGGVVSTTGVAGLTLGGGLGWLRRKHGLSCDNLIAADVVTADGRLVHASETENADLLWGLRGGGGNFGVVTTFTFRLHEVGPIVMFAGAMYPFESASRLLPAWRDFMAQAPEEVSSQALLWSIPAVDAFPRELHGRAVFIVVALYCGPWKRGERILQPLRDLDTPLIDLSGALPFAQVQQLYDAFFPKGTLQYYWKSLSLNRLDDEVITTLLDHAARRPSPHTLIPIWHHGGAMSRIGAGDTAYGDRSAPYLLSLDTTWVHPEETQENIAWTRLVWDDMHRFSSGNLYLNFPGLGEEGEALVRAAYGSNYERLVALKNRYDPTNLFRLNQNIRPTA